MNKALVYLVLLLTWLVSGVPLLAVHAFDPMLGLNFVLGMVAAIGYRVWQVERGVWP